MNRLYKKLGIKKGVTAIIGSGGKTTLIRRLAYELRADGFCVIVTTSTKIFIPSYCPLICNPAEKREESAALIRKVGIAAVGIPILTREGRVKLDRSEASFEELAAIADFVLVEADGSKHLPLKAHAEYEPVIPKSAVRTVMVVGLNGIGRPISEVVHRSEIFSRISGRGLEEAVTPEALATVINAEDLADVLYVTGNREEEVERNEREADCGTKLAGLVNYPVIMGDELWTSDK